MESIFAFFSSKSECFNCHRSLRFKRIRQCQVCKMLYCRNCSDVRKIKGSKKICVICNSNESIRSVIKPGLSPLIVKSDEAADKANEAIQPHKEIKSLPTKLSFLAARPDDIEEKDPSDYYEILKKIGEGGSGQVFIAQHKESGKKYALKSITPKSASEKDIIMNEVTLFSSSRHPNILEFVEAFHFKNTIWIVTEVLGCSLTELIINRPSQIPEYLIAYICKEILKGLSFFHSQHRIHRDVKSDNVLLGLDGKVKLADLGFAVQLLKEKDQRSTVVGTPSWMAPELAMGLKYNVSVDIWSLGIVALEMGDGEPPLLGRDPLKIISMIVSKPAPTLKNKKKWSSEFNRFIEKCLNKEPNERPSADQLLTDPFIINIPDDAQIQFSIYLYNWTNSKL